MKKVQKRSIYWSYSTIEIHIVIFWSSYFVFCCLYSFLNIYYKYIIFRFSIPPAFRYLENFQPSLLMRPNPFIWPSQVKNIKLCVPVITLSAKNNQKLSKVLSKGYERSVYRNEYKTKSENTWVYIFSQIKLCTS